MEFSLFMELFLEKEFLEIDLVREECVETRLDLLDSQGTPLLPGTSRNNDD